MSVDIDVVQEATEEVAGALCHLVPQLSTSAALPDLAAVRRIVDSQATTLLAARLDGKIVGFLSLVMFPKPSKATDLTKSLPTLIVPLPVQSFIPLESRLPKLYQGRSCSRGSSKPFTSSSRNSLLDREKYTGHLLVAHPSA